MRKFLAILYLLSVSTLSLWSIDSIVARQLKPEFGTAPHSQRVELLFVGDVMAHTPQLARAKGADGYDFNSCFRYVKPIFEQADCVVANLETTLSCRPPYSGYPLFCTPQELAYALAWAGVDVAAVANNHSLDMGAEGLRSTIDILAKHDISSVGTSATTQSCEPLRLEIKGIKFAILAYTYGTNGIPIPNGVNVGIIDTLQMERDLATCSDADCRIAFLHWGDEYARRPNRVQREIADFLHSKGCQVVIGSHPHVVQKAECSKNEVTVYSLGNFISNQRMRYSDGGVMAKVIVEKEVDGCSYSLDIQPVWVRKSDYAIIPSTTLSEVQLSPEEQADCSVFMEDCKKIFNSI